jgi:hypothetical protein
MTEVNGNGTPEHDSSSGVPIDGRIYTLKDLTFRERRELRQMIRDSIGRPDAELYDVVDDADLVPCIVYLVKRRTDSAYTLDMALDLTEAELAGEAEVVPPPVADPEPAFST